MKLKYPVNYIAITQYYKKGVHNGIDLGWSSLHGGNEQPVYSPGDGEVIMVESNYNRTDSSGGSYGNFVKIKHTNEISTLCAHMKYGSVTLKVGDKVKQGDQIGLMGKTGHANGNHVHYEVFLNKEKVNPEEYTYVYKGQTVSSNESATRGLLYYNDTPTPSPDPTPTPNEEALKKKIQELEDKVSLQLKEIESLKEQLTEEKQYEFTYPVLKTSLYEIKLNEGETLLIKG